MTISSIAISRDLVVAGIEQKAAVAIAEAIVTHVSESHATKADITGLRSEIAELRSETKADIAELKSEIAELRSETKADIAELKSEIAELRSETKADIAELRSETKADIAELRSETKAELTRLGGKIETVVVQVKLLIGLVIGLYGGLAALFVERLSG